MPSAFLLWDRKEKMIVGVSGATPTLYSSSQNATNAVDRVNKHNGGQASSKTFDVITVTIP